jgi:3-dehydroquinate dehydratase/shikimate dehydrogenase
VVKVAYRARSLRDAIEILDLPALLRRPTVALGMGEFGLLTRVLAPKFGGFLTFAALRPAVATAPGQPTIADLLQLFRFRRSGPEPRSTA